MPAINTFPTIVVNNILRYAVQKYVQYSENDWKKSFSVLAICPEWRQLAIPLVYQDVYIEMESGSEGCLGCSFDGYLQSAQCKSNVDLFKSTGNTALAKRLFISLDSLADLNSLVDNFFNIFEVENFDWTELTSLQIHLRMLSTDSDPSLEGKYSHMYEKEYLEFGNALVKHMPNVSNLILHISPMSVEANYFGNVVIHCYRNRLVSLTTGTKMIPGFEMAFFNLRVLEIDIQSNSFNLEPCVDKLVELDITHCPSGYDWSNFGHSDQIVFSKLRRLSIRFESTEEYAGDQQQLLVTGTNPNNSLKLCFPSLKHLSLELSSLDDIQNMLCFDMYQWPNVEHLYISEDVLYSYDSGDYNQTLDKNISIVAECIRQNMPKLRSLSISYIRNPFAQYELEAKLLSQYSAQLSSFKCLRPISYERANFNSTLTNLVINARLSPELSILRMCADSLVNLDIDNLSPYFVWPADGQNGLTFRNLDCLTVGYDTEGIDAGRSINRFIEQMKRKKSSGKINCPNLVTVSIHNSMLESLSNLLRFGEQEWTNVIDLFVRYEGIDNTEYTDGGLNAELEYSVREFADQIAINMPNVQRLSMLGTPLSPFEQGLLNLLCKKYAKQLTSINGELGGEYCTDTVLERPRFIQGCLKSLDRPKMQFCTEMLNNAFLTAYIEGRFWEWFNDNGSLNSYNFDNLEYLHICMRSIREYDEGANKEVEKEWPGSMPLDLVSAPMDRLALSKFRFDVFMPKINSILIESDDSYNELASTHVHVDDIKQVTFVRQAGAFPICETPDRVRINDLKIMNITANVQEKDHFYSMTNSWLGGQNPIDSSYMSIDKIPFALDPDMVNWKNLKFLSCSSAVTYGNLFALLQKLTSLAKLSINIRPEGIPEYIEQDLENKEIKTLSSTLIFIGLTADDVSQDSWQMAAAATEYLLLALPCLIKANINRRISPELPMLKEKYGQRYTHVNNLVIES